MSATGMDRVDLAKRWLEGTTKVELPFDVYNNAPVCTLRRLDGNAKRYDLFGQIHTSSPTPLYVEVKDYDSTAGKPDAEYWAFLANAYSITAQDLKDGEDARREFMRVTHHTFQQTDWVKLTSAERIKKALEEHHPEALNGETIDADLLETVSDRLWLCVLHKHWDVSTLSFSPEALPEVAKDEGDVNRRLGATWQDVRMSAKASREATGWNCPNGPHPAPLPALIPAFESPDTHCIHCGALLQEVTIREERKISWSGRLSPGVISEALDFGPGGWLVAQSPESTAAAVRQSIEEQSVPQKNIDVLILAALPKELDAVRSNSGPWKREQDTETGFEYWITTAYHGLTIAASGMTSMGPVSAAVTTSNALTALKPKRVILVGICAAIAPHVRLGDVCVARQLVDYDLGKVKHGKYTPRWNVFPADPQLLRSAMYFQSTDWVDTVLTKRPKNSTTQPKVHFGTILTGSKIVADAEFVRELRSVWTQAIGLEMEGGGAAAAALDHPTQPSLLLVKGVCDRANLSKNDSWQAYAADAAARYAISLLIDRGSAELETPATHEPILRRDPFESFGLTAKQVRTVLTESFNTNDLRNLCQDLNIEWEELENRGTRSGAAHDVIEECRRQRALEQLLEAVERSKTGVLGRH